MQDNRSPRATRATTRAATRKFPPGVHDGVHWREFRSTHQSTVISGNHGRVALTTNVVQVQDVIEESTLGLAVFMLKFHLINDATQSTLR